MVATWSPTDDACTPAACAFPRGQCSGKGAKSRTEFDSRSMLQLVAHARLQIETCVKVYKAHRNAVDFDSAFIKSVVAGEPSAWWR